MQTSVADEFFYCHRKEIPVSTPTDENRSLLTVVAYMRAAEGKTEELRAALEALIEPKEIPVRSMNPNLHTNPVS